MGSGEVSTPLAVCRASTAERPEFTLEHGEEGRMIYLTLVQAYATSRLSTDVTQDASR